MSKVHSSSNGKKKVEQPTQQNSTVILDREAQKTASSFTSKRLSESVANEINTLKKFRGW
jgi:hypothetical protein